MSGPGEGATMMDEGSQGSEREIERERETGLVNTTTGHLPSVVAGTFSARYDLNSGLRHNWQALASLNSFVYVALTIEPP